LTDVLTSKRFWKDFDWFLLLVALLLCAIGLVEIYSSTMNMDADNYFLRQLTWVGIGVSILFVVASVDYRVLGENALLIYVAAVGFLGALLLFAEPVSNARSWFQIGSVGLQPSELTKLVVVVALARYFSTLPQRYLHLKQVLAAIAVVALPVALVAIQPDLGTALTYIPILAFGLFVRGVRPVVLVSGTLVLVVLLTVGWFVLADYVLADYQKDRIMTFLEPGSDPLGSGYQVNQSKIAIGSGGLWGRGIFEGSQNQLGFLPTRHTDFIFSVVAEELGFVGVSFTLALLLALVFRALSLTARPRDTFGLFLVVGVAGMFVGHIVINVGMVIGFLPSTGIPLPFLSYGGSSMVTAFTALGLVASVRRCRYVN
jgi:rod shape determining protein RodA